MIALLLTVFMLAIVLCGFYCIDKTQIEVTIIQYRRTIALAKLAFSLADLSNYENKYDLKTNNNIQDVINKSQDPDIKLFLSALITPQETLDAGNRIVSKSLDIIRTPLEDVQNELINHLKRVPKSLKSTRHELQSLLDSTNQLIEQSQKLSKN